MPDFEVLDAKIASALNRIIHNSHFKRRVSLEEQKAQKRGPFPSRKTDRSPDLRVLSGSLEPMIPSRIMPTYLLLLFEMMILRNSIQNGTEFYFHVLTSWKACTNEEYESLRNSRPYWNCTTWRFIRRKQDLIITD